MPVLPDELTYFTVTRTIYSESPVVANVRFDALVSREVLPADLDAGIIEILMEPVYGRIDAGVLVAEDGTTGVRLISAAQVEVTNGGLHYQATFYDTSVPLPKIVFAALAEDDTFDLKDAAVVAAKTGVPTFRGPAGRSFAGLEEVNGGTAIRGLVESDSGPVAVGDPVDLLPGPPGVGIVTHGSNADYPRPDTDDPVLWLGSVEPNNSLPGDAWVSTAGAAPVITTTSLGTITHGVAMTPKQLAATGTTPITWAVVSGLPTGLTLTSGGILWGTATSAGAYTLTVSATNGYGSDEYEYDGTIA